MKLHDTTDLLLGRIKPISRNLLNGKTGKIKVGIVFGTAVIVSGDGLALAKLANLYPDKYAFHKKYKIDK